MFLHPYLLAGLAACAIPLLLHLLQNQKPRRLVFPAFRFLLQKRSTNQRRMQIRNLLLMLLRMLVLAALVFALARPRLSAGPAGPLGGREARVAVLIDTSPSMEYSVAGVTRLDEAKRRAIELFSSLGEGSRVAVLDSGDLADEPFVPIPDARARLDRLTIRPGAGPLNRAAERALDLLARQRQPDGPALALYALTDRTRASWDQRGTIPRVPEGVSVLIVDVAAPSPKDLGIESVEVVPPVVVPGGGYQVRVRLRGTPTGHEDRTVSCEVDGKVVGTLPVQMPAEQDTDTVVFDLAAPSVRPAQDAPVGLKVRLGRNDNMPFNDRRHATLIVRGGRRMLTLVSSRDTAGVWPLAQDALQTFANETRTFGEAPTKLDPYSVVALCQVDEVPVEWWGRLEGFVRNGGGLAIIPGGEEVRLALFNDGGRNLLPAALDRIVDAPAGKPLYWDRFGRSHPLLAPFADWVRKGDPDFARAELRPFVRRYWALGPMARGAVEIIPYAAKGRPAALAERRIGRGLVVMFTTPLDTRAIDPKLGTQWTNYWQDSSFGLVLVDRVSRHLAGEEGGPELAFPCGAEVAIRVPSPITPPYKLAGETVGPAERALKVPPATGDLSIPQARQPGNYIVLDGKGQAVAGFSLDVPGREGDLTRIGVEELEAIFGRNCVAEPGRGSLADALAGGQGSPTELLPWLMMALLAVMAAEGLLANRYYSSPPESETEAARA